MKIEHTIAVALATAHWADRIPVKETNIKTGDIVNSQYDSANFKVLRTLGNYCIVEDVATAKQTVRYLPDLTKVTNKKSLGCMLRYHKDQN